MRYRIHKMLRIGYYLAGALLLLVLLSLTNLRLLISPIFPAVEYARPGFPPDPYGDLTTSDRLHWAGVLAQYLDQPATEAGPTLALAALRFPPGQQMPPDSCRYAAGGDCTLLLNRRELRHLVDVRDLWWSGKQLWGLAALGTLAILGEAWLRSRRRFYLVLVSGAALTLAIYFCVLVALVTEFRAWMYLFHVAVFAGDSGFFLESDTLIRLFPSVFWRDAAVLFGLLSLAEVLALGAWALARLRGAIRTGHARTAR